MADPSSDRRADTPYDDFVIEERLILVCPICSALVADRAVHDAWHGNPHQTGAQKNHERWHAKEK